VNTIMIIPVPRSVGKLLSGCTTGGFSTRAQLDGISYNLVVDISDRLCGLVVRVLDYRSRGPGSIPGTNKKSSGSGTGSTQPRENN
jgi:hypothetical protein